MARKSKSIKQKDSSQEYSEDSEELPKQIPPKQESTNKKQKEQLSSKKSDVQPKKRTNRKKISSSQSAEQSDFEPDKISQLSESESQIDLQSESDFEESAKNSTKQNGQKKTSVTSQQSTRSNRSSKKSAKNQKDQDEYEQKQAQGQQERDTDKQKVPSEDKAIQFKEGAKQYTEQDLPWFLQKKYIRDINGKTPEDDGYDPTTLDVPANLLKQQGPLFKQYWSAKSQNYDQIVFFRMGRQFFVYYSDAFIVGKMFDRQIFLWGKRPFICIFDKQFFLYSKKLIEQGISFVTVDQMEFNEHKENDEYIRREITQISTPGTFIDYEMDNYTARYLVAIFEDRQTKTFGIAACDCTTHEFFIDNFSQNGEKGTFSNLRNVLHKLKPVEVLVNQTNISEQTLNACQSVSNPVFTTVTTNQQPNLKEIFTSLKTEFRIPGQEILKQIQDLKQKFKSLPIHVAETSKSRKKGKQIDDQEEKEEMIQVEFNDENDIVWKQNPQYHIEQARLLIDGDLDDEYPTLLREIQESYEKEMLNTQQQNKDAQVDFSFQFYQSLQALLFLVEYLRQINLHENVYRLGSFNLLDYDMQRKKFMFMDADALQNLEIFESNYLSKDNEDGSLFSYINHTQTDFGRRMLRKWVSLPLKDQKEIEERQTCVRDLMDHLDLVEKFQDQIKAFPDLERQISRVYNSIQKTRLRATAFDNFPISRLKEFHTLIKKMLKINQIIKTTFQTQADTFKSSRLKQMCQIQEHKQIDESLISAEFNVKRDSEMEIIEDQYSFQKTPANKDKKKSYLVDYINKVNEKSNKKTKQSAKGQEKVLDEGIFPYLNETLIKMEKMIQFKEDGMPFPAKGMSADFDRIQNKIEELEKKLDLELEKYQQIIGYKDISFYHLQIRYQISIPEHLVEGKKQPDELILTSQVKGFLRFHTQLIENTLPEIKSYEKLRIVALIPFIRDYFKQFYKYRSLWNRAVNILAELDSLCALAICSQKMETQCLPEIIDEDESKIDDDNDDSDGSQDSQNQKIQNFQLHEMIHPCLQKAGFKMVANDTTFDNKTQILLVTGPNMGGQSTLLRQTCVAVILAQLGSYIPAKYFQLKPIDRIFCRIGANDRLAQGKSTFYVEMEETSFIVKEATKDSLVIMDQLGRGTSTFDGFSIAYGVLQFISDQIKCKTLFSTHYHLLIEEFRLYQNVKNYVMDYEYNEKKKEMVFQYQFIEGEAQQSFGINVAQVVALPQKILQIAEEKDEEMNSEKQQIGLVKQKTQNFNSIMNIIIEYEQNKEIDSLINDLGQLNF